MENTPVQYDVRTAWYNYTRRGGTTFAGMLLSRNGTKTGRYMILAYDVTLSVRCSDTCDIPKLSAINDVCFESHKQLKSCS